MATRPTIKDVARYAGVSISTVSLAYNHPERVSDEARFKIYAIADKLNYKPDRIARSMVTKKTHLIGLVVSDITDPFFAEVYKGIEDALNEKGLSIILFNTDNNIEKEIEAVNLLMEQRVDGVLLAPIGTENEHIYHIRERDMPVCFIDRDIPDMDFSCVKVNNLEGAYTATQYLIEQGHTNIEFIGGKENLETTSQRVMGYQKAMEEHQLTISINYTNSKTDGGYETTRYLLTAQEADVGNTTAFFVASDIVAYGVVNAILDNGREIPDDFSLVGFDDIPYSKNMRVPLTTIKQPSYELGKRATELLLNMENTDFTDQKIVLDTELIIRDSVKAIVNV